MSDEMSDRLAEALRPLAEFIAANIGVMERAAEVYETWGVGWLEALANGYVDEGESQ